MIKTVKRHVHDQDGNENFIVLEKGTECRVYRRVVLHRTPSDTLLVEIPALHNRQFHLPADIFDRRELLSVLGEEDSHEKNTIDDIASMKKHEMTPRLIAQAALLSALSELIWREVDKYDNEGLDDIGELLRPYHPDPSVSGS